jgi:uncharacterized protein YlzI (FlbEa/FlbD family)
MKVYKWRAYFPLPSSGLNYQELDMIQLTRLNNHPLVVNSDLIKFVEQAPDTVITLVGGDKIVVLESARDVLERVAQFRRSVLGGIAVSPDQISAPSPIPGCIGHPAGTEKEKE